MAGIVCAARRRLRGGRHLPANARLHRAGGGHRRHPDLPALDQRGSRRGRRFFARVQLRALGRVQADLESLAAAPLRCRASLQSARLAVPRCCAVQACWHADYLRRARCLPGDVRGQVRQTRPAILGCARGGMGDAFFRRRGDRHERVGARHRHWARRPVAGRCVRRSHRAEDRRHKRRAGCLAEKRTQASRRLRRRDGQRRRRALHHRGGGFLGARAGSGRHPVFTDGLRAGTRQLGRASR